MASDTLWALIVLGGAALAVLTGVSVYTFFGGYWYQLRKKK